MFSADSFTESWVVKLKKKKKKLTFCEGFPGGSLVRNPSANAIGVGLIPGLGRSPAEGNGSPLQYSFLGNPMDRGAWRPTDHGVAKQ